MFTREVYEGRKAIDTASLKFKTFYQKVKRLSDTYSKVKKSKNEDYINEFMNKEFQLPSLCITQSLSTSQTQRELSRLQPDLTSASYVVSNIAQELNSERSKAIMLEQEIEAKSQENVRLQKDVNDISERENRKTVDLKRTRLREEYHRGKVTKLENQIHDKNPDEKIRKLQDKIKSLQQENTELRRTAIMMEYERDVDREHLAAVQDKTIELFDPVTLKYTTEVQKCVHTLLENHVSTHRVGSVLEACLKLVDKNLTG